MTASPAAPPIRRILVLRTGHIGDVVLMTPALDLLNRLFPGAEISALVRAGAQPVLEHHPLIKRIYTGGEIVGQQKMLIQKKTSLWTRLRQVPNGLRVIRELRRQHFDLAVDFTGGDRTSFFAFLSGATTRVAYTKGPSGIIGRNRLFTHICFTPLKREHRVWKDVELLRTVAKATGRDALLNELVPGPGLMKSSPEDLAWARERWQQATAGAGPRLVIHPVARALYKCWPGDRWSALIDRLIRDFRANLLVTSGPEPKELELARRILAGCANTVPSHPGDLTIGRLAALIHEADLFVGVDTAPMHIAAAVGTRVAAVFGPSDQIAWGPWGAGHRVVRRLCPCLESRTRGCLEAQGMDCLKALTVDEVYEAVRQCLDEWKGSVAVKSGS